MKILLTLFVLLFSSSVVAETYICINGKMLYFTSSDMIHSKMKYRDVELLIDQKNKIIKYDGLEFKNYKEDKDFISSLITADVKSLKLTQDLEVTFNRKTKKLIWSQKSISGFIMEGVHAIDIYHNCKFVLEE